VGSNLPTARKVLSQAALYRLFLGEERVAFLQTILHTGDMRWQDSMAQHPALLKQKIDYLFLDTTYASPKHTHPPQVTQFYTSPPSPHPALRLRMQSCAAPY